MQVARRILLAGCVGLWLVLSQGCASGPPPTATELGLAALAEGNWQLAKTHFAEALQVDAGDGAAWLGQARAELAGRDPESALRSLTSLARTDRPRFSGEAQTTYANALAAATRARIERDQYEAALLAVRALVDLQPERRGIDRLLGEALIGEAGRQLMSGERQKALALYREACTVAPQRLEAWVGAAEILLVTGQGKQAVRLLESARKFHPTAGSIRTLTLQALRFR